MLRILLIGAVFYLIMVKVVPINKQGLTFSAKSRYPTTTLLKPTLNLIIFTASCSLTLSSTFMFANSFSLVACSSLSLVSFNCCCCSEGRFDDVLWAFLFSFFNSFTNFVSLPSAVSSSALALPTPCSPKYLKYISVRNFEPYMNRKFHQ